MNSKSLMGMIIGIIFSVFYFYYYIHAHKGISLYLAITISANFCISLGILSTLIISKAFYQIKVTLTEAMLSFLALGVLLNASSSGIAETMGLVLSSATFEFEG